MKGIEPNSIPTFEEQRLKLLIPFVFCNCCQYHQVYEEAAKKLKLPGNHDYFVLFLTEFSIHVTASIMFYEDMTIAFKPKLQMLLFTV